MICWAAYDREGQLVTDGGNEATEGLPGGRGEGKGSGEMGSYEEGRSEGTRFQGHLYVDFNGMNMSADLM